MNEALCVRHSQRTGRPGDQKSVHRHHVYVGSFGMKFIIWYSCFSHASLRHLWGTYGNTSDGESWHVCHATGTAWMQALQLYGEEWVRYLMNLCRSKMADHMTRRTLCLLWLSCAHNIARAIATHPSVQVALQFSSKSRRMENNVGGPGLMPLSLFVLAAGSAWVCRVRVHSQKQAAAHATVIPVALVASYIHSTDSLSAWPLHHWRILFESACRRCASQLQFFLKQKGEETRLFSRIYCTWQRTR